MEQKPTPTSILNSAREGIGDPEEIRWALIQVGELDGGCFVVVAHDWIPAASRGFSVGQTCDGALTSGLWNAGANDEGSLQPPQSAPGVDIDAVHRNPRWAT